MILGQTATGKSDLAVKLAKKINGEIISSDSRQVYKGLDIGTGKITKKEMGGVPHYLLDVESPKNQFNVAEYKKLAEEKIEVILKNEKVPIICGGTGFYIQSIVDNVVYPEVPPNFNLRAKLSKLSAEKLFGMLKKIDPERAKNIEAKNPVRLIRAIEIAKALGKVPVFGRRTSKHRILQIGIKLPDEVLKERIYKRLISRIKEGMILEAKKLHRNGLSWKRMNELGLEYRYLALYLQKKLNKKEMIDQLNTSIWHYAKRQWTWFKRDKKIIWINPFKKSDLKKLETLVKKFLS